MGIRMFALAVIAGIGLAAAPARADGRDRYEDRVERRERGERRERREERRERRAREREERRDRRLGRYEWRVVEHVVPGRWESTWVAARCERLSCGAVRCEPGRWERTWIPARTEHRGEWVWVPHLHRFYASRY